MAETTTTTTTGTTTTTPPYAPYPAFDGVIEEMAKTFVPGRVDAELMKGLNHGTRSHVISTFKALGLIDSGNHPTDALDVLVEARKAGEEAWSEALERTIRGYYSWAFEGLDITRVTSKQLRERFSAVGGVDGVMNDRAIRFFVKALKDAKVSYSPHLKARKPRTAAKRMPKTATPSTNGTTPNHSPKPPAGDSVAKTDTLQSSAAAVGLISFPVYIKDKLTGVVMVPPNITTKDCAILKVVVELIECYAKQNEIQSEGKEVR